MPGILPAILTGSRGVVANIGSGTSLQGTKKFSVGDQVRVKKGMQGGGKKGTITESSTSGYHHVSSGGKHLGVYHESDLTHNADKERDSRGAKKTPADKAHASSDITGGNGAPGGNTPTDGMMDSQTGGDEVTQAQQKYQEALQKAEEAEKEAERIKTEAQAKKAGEEADKRTKETTKHKPMSVPARRAHHNAATAHADAAALYKQAGSSKMGKDLDSRGKHGRRAEYHAAMAKQHQQQAQMTGVLNSGSKGVMAIIRGITGH